MSQPLVTLRLTRLEADGRYHLNNLGWAETYRDGVRDGINDLASVRGVFPVAIQWDCRM